MMYFLLNKYRSVLAELAGSFLVAVGMYNFAASASFPMTGFSGISLILYRLFSIPMGLSNIVMNIPVAIICYRILGKGFFFRSVRCMIISSLMIDYLAPLLPQYSGDRLLAALCTGILSGMGYALIYMQNSSTGGADFIIMAWRAKKPYMALGNITFLFAVAVIALTWVIFGDADGVIYGVLINYLSGFVINKMMYGVNSKKFMLIVTEDGPRLSNAIEELCHRGSTIINALGGYQNDPRQVVFCVCDNKQAYDLQKMVRAVDPDSFMTIWEANEVRGNGFRVVAPGQKD